MRIKTMKLLTTRQQVENIRKRFEKLVCQLNARLCVKQCDMGNLYYCTKSHSTELPSTTQLLNIEQVLWVLQVGRSTLYNLINQHQLTAVKIGDRTLFRPSDLEQFINNLNQYGE